MNIKSRVIETIKENFRFSTLNFLFIIAYVNIFQRIFGPENSIVGVIFTIMMSASMVRDLTATPIRHFCFQSIILVWMAAAAFLVNTLPVPLSFFINFITLLVILYAFTYEYSSHMYFPYILSYLFLVFISPVTAQQLPKRMLAMVAGAVSIILYQLFKGRKRVEETARDVLTEMVDDNLLFISYKQGKTDQNPALSQARLKLCRLSQTVYQRRKKVLCISDAGFSLIAAGRGLEHLQILLNELPQSLSSQEEKLLLHTTSCLNTFRAFLQQEIAQLPDLQPFQNTDGGSTATEGLFSDTLLYIQDRLVHMTDPQRKSRYRKSALSLKIRIQTALDLSPVRAVYALRTALLLSCATGLVQFLSLPHGKWFLFTLASVSLPYADDVPRKIQKRVLATVLGGILSIVIYSLVPSPAGRTAAMMASGYLSFYFTDYAETFTCSTIGALGGAVFLNAFGFRDVGRIFLIRLAYILAGALAGYAINCLLIPYTRAKATRQLWKKYKGITQLLTQVTNNKQMDTQLYYHLVIQAHMQEEKLTENALLEKWSQFPALLAQHQEKIRMAHRSIIEGRKDAPIFHWAHLS